MNQHILNCLFGTQGRGRARESGEGRSPWGGAMMIQMAKPSPFRKAEEIFGRMRSLCPKQTPSAPYVSKVRPPIRPPFFRVAGCVKSGVRAFVGCFYECV
jgi:hypothetical protein